jgi:hypothetical protein
MRSLNRPSCGTRFFGDVQLRHHLDARDDRPVELLGNRTHGRLQHAVDSVFHVDRIVLGLDVDVARSPLDGREDCRVDEPDDRTDVAREPLDRERVLARLIFLEQLQLEAFGRVLENPLRTLALLQDRLDRGLRPDGNFERRRQEHAELVDHGHVGGVGDDYRKQAAFPPVRDEPVAQHQVSGDRPEQFRIDPERIHVDELQPIALGQPPGVFEFGNVFIRTELRRVGVQRGGIDVSHA